MMQAVKINSPVRSLELAGDTLQLSCKWVERDIGKALGGKWNSEERCWEYALSIGIYTEIVQHFPGIRIPQNVRSAVMKMACSEVAAAAEPVAPEKPIDTMFITKKPFAHQVTAFNLGLSIPAVGFWAEMGTGKTLMTIAVICTRFIRGEVNRVLVVAPASVVPNWEKEFAEYAGVPFEVISLTGPVKSRVKELAKFEIDPFVLQIAVTNYEAVWRMEDEIKKWKPDMIVADEAQRMKGAGNQQSRAMHRLGAKAPYRIALSGTPIGNSPLDLYSIYKFLDPTIFGTNKIEFQKRYAVMGGFEGREIVGFDNVPELVQKMYSIAYRVTKKQALDLPEFTDQTLYCRLEANAERLYNQMVKDSVIQFENDQELIANSILSQLLRLSQITGGFLLDGEGNMQNVSLAKMKLLEETLLDVLGFDRKVVIFARFLPEIAAIESMLVENGIGYALIKGSVPMDQRGAEVDRFQTNELCKVFVAQIQTAGLGITLHAADTAIYYSMDYSFLNYDQSRARIHRIGQKSTCTYISLCVQHSVDEKIIAALREKKNVSDEIVDNWKFYFKLKG